MRLLAAVPGPLLQDAGFVEMEVSATGEAMSYKCDDLAGDGRWVLEERDRAPYVTRVLVRRPKEPARFNGTVVVEWLNVSSGDEAAPDYTYLAAELLRGGYAWAGVSAQYAGVEGGPPAVVLPYEGIAGAGLKGLRHIDPLRYGSLHHPGDAYCYDIFTQVARALASPELGGPLDGLEVQRALAVGQSQSAFALTTYVKWGTNPHRSVRRLPDSQPIQVGRSSGSARRATGDSACASTGPGSTAR